MENESSAVWTLLLCGGYVTAMNHFMNSIALSTISVFDVGNKPSESAPERFYHGFVLGLLVELNDDYTIESNRESGFGRYDIMLIPKKQGLNGIIIEFKVISNKKEASLEETAANALKQINDMQYEQHLLDLGLDHDKIKKYGFAFEGKEVLIVEGE